MHTNSLPSSSLRNSNCHPAETEKLHGKPSSQSDYLPTTGLHLSSRHSAVRERYCQTEGAMDQTALVGLADSALACALFRLPTWCGSLHSPHPIFPTPPNKPDNSVRSRPPPHSFCVFAAVSLPLALARLSPPLPISPHFSCHRGIRLC